MFDKDLIKKAKQKDKKALEKLYRQNFASLYKYIRFKVSTDEIAEDICAEAFTRAFENIDKFKETSSFKTWIYSIAKNIMFDWVKNKNVEINDAENFENYPDRRRDPGIAPSEKVKSEALVKVVMDNLKESYKEVLTLRYLMNYSLKETADAMHKNTNNIKILQHRALKSANEILKKLNYDTKIFATTK